MPFYTCPQLVPYALANLCSDFKIRELGFSSDAVSLSDGI